MQTFSDKLKREILWGNLFNEGSMMDFMRECFLKMPNAVLYIKPSKYAVQLTNNSDRGGVLKDYLGTYSCDIPAAWGCEFQKWATDNGFIVSPRILRDGSLSLFEVRLY